jgi:hypothetical protein
MCAVGIDEVIGFEILQGSYNFENFIEFINTGALELGIGPIDLNQVIKESPKLTGVKDLQELKATLDFNFSSYENFQNEVLKFKPNALTKEYLDFISKFTNTSPDVLLSFTELNEALSNYQVAMKKENLRLSAQKL